VSLREPGLWVARRRSRELTAQPALFLDRDGTIMIDRPYLGDPAGVELLPQTVSLMRAVAAADFPLIIVTNQSGIARGHLNWSDFERVTQRLCVLLEEAGCAPDAVIACAYHQSADPELNHPDHRLRKPNPGMLHLAAREWGIDLASSVIAGDRDIDMRAGAAAGLWRGLMVGHALAPSLGPDFAVDCPDQTQSWAAATGAVMDALQRPQNAAGS
jgi:D-glycero-D-manno-heptose 1,7-bisphosphate phosphatase